MSDPDSPPSEPPASRRPTRSDAVVAGLLDRCDFPGSGPLSCAVSGGADSVAMLALAVATGRDVTAVHVDHGLRPGSEVESVMVGRLAGFWGASFRSETVVVGEGPDLEQRARNARRAVLGTAALFGHTMDDQAETVLIRLLRGTGPSGLARMDPATHPILALRRSETRSLCEHLGVAVVEDPTNADPRFVRNRVRNELVPLMDDIAGRDVVTLLARLAAQASEQRHVVDALAAEVDPSSAAELRAVPRAVAVAALGRWWQSCSGSAHPPDSAALTRMLAVADGDAVGCEVHGGWSLRRSRGRLHLYDRAGAEGPGAGGVDGPAG